MEVVTTYEVKPVVLLTFRHNDGQGPPSRVNHGRGEEDVELAGVSQRAHVARDPQRDGALSGARLDPAYDSIS